MTFLKRGLIAKLVFLLVAGSALAENRQNSLFKRLNRPATVAGHNSPSAFAKYLNKENEQKTVLAPSKEGSDPFEADVWVFFFQNEAEVRSMPKLIQEVYDAIPQKDADHTVSSYIEFELSNGNSKAASFHIIENYEGDSDETIACKAAVAVYSGVSGNTYSFDRRKRAKECEGLK